jgi:hypothetical protein
VARCSAPAAAILERGTVCSPAWHVLVGGLAAVVTVAGEVLVVGTAAVMLAARFLELVVAPCGVGRGRPLATGSLLELLPPVPRCI